MKFCRGCGRPVTGQQVLAALARMIEQGLTAQEAKARSPSCFACARKSAPGTRLPIAQPASEKTKQTRSRNQTQATECARQVQVLPRTAEPSSVSLGGET